MVVDDTIVAQATPYGRSGIGILRISGTHVQDVAHKILHVIPPARYAYYSSFFDISGTIIDQGIAVWYPKPYSFTGEDVLELQGHGNPVILDILIKNILSIKNVRIAYPGEFSKRAFLNRKLDLIQSESIIKLIHADSEASIKSALRSLQGFFSKKIHHLIDSITHIRTLIEADINFPEDNININFKNIEIELINITLNIKKITQSAQLGKKIEEGIKVVIIGPSNSGKSSIYNALLLHDAAIVTNIQGTTRDILHDDIYIDGMNFKFIDTAGFRSTHNVIEKIGIKKTWDQIKVSDHIFFVLDDTLEFYEKENTFLKFINKIPKKKNITILLNKSDLLGHKACFVPFLKQYQGVKISAKTGDGINLLKRYLKEKYVISIHNTTETVFLARRRHLKILELVTKEIYNVQNEWKIEKNIELLSENLKNIQNMLNEITGSITSEKILDSIFSKFCIGK